MHSKPFLQNVPKFISNLVAALAFGVRGGDPERDADLDRLEPSSLKVGGLGSASNSLIFDSAGDLFS